MRFIQTAIPELVLLESEVYSDDRGWFMESFNERRFHAGLRELGLPEPRPFVQDNHSCSKKGVLRGLHYQLPPYGQGKLVRVIRGSAFDVAVDIRKNSPTFGNHVAVHLSEANNRCFWIPEGFAHGFLALEENTQLFYKTTNYYAKEYEAAIRWSDPFLSINWPSEPIFISDKDQLAPFLGGGPN